MSIAKRNGQQWGIGLLIMLSQATCFASVVDLVGSDVLQLTIHSDFEFEDNLLPPEFTVATGSNPAMGGGVLTFDGSTAVTALIEDVYGGTKPADNYGYDIVFTPSAVSDVFDIIASISDDTDFAGSFLFRQDLGDGDTYNILEVFEQFGTGTVTPVIGQTLALAFVMNDGVGQLYVNGVLDTSITFDADGPTPIDTATLEFVVLGGSYFDTVLGGTGGANGTIDRVRFFTLGTPGDFDGDSYVDAADFFAWQRGESPRPFSGSDLELWQENYGPSTSMAASYAVPEPSSAFFCAFGVLGYVGLSRIRTNCRG